MKHVYTLGPFGVVWHRPMHKIGVWVWFSGRQRYWEFRYDRAAV